MALPKKYNTIIINALLAVVVCLVINFSYLLAIRDQDRRDSEETQRRQEWLRELENSPSVTGVLRIAKDGYGHIVMQRYRDNFTDTLPPPIDTLAIVRADSVYVAAQTVNELSLVHGDTLRVITREARWPGGNPAMRRLLDVNGEPFDYGERFDHPSDNRGVTLQLVFYWIFTFVLLTVMTAGASRDASMKFYLKRAAYCIVIAIILWMAMPMVRPRSEGELTIMAMMMKGGLFSSNRFFPVDIMLMKSLFALALALLYGRTFQLINQREGIMLENEQLKNENLRSRYNTLVNQINPHFLFNSLNSLSALVRESKSDDAIRYIDRLSDTFRYTIRDADTTTTLGEELEFTDAYKYLLEVRYAEKLFIDIDIEEEKRGWMLPTFSIQPLIENAVKHNTITRSKPLHISIRTEGNCLVVSNPINPKIEPEKGTGIGLANLSNRWQLLTGQDIEIKNDGAIFSVSLPFIEGEKR
jgi:hypothetical protein